MGCAAAAAGVAAFSEGFRYVFCRHYSRIAGLLLDTKGHDDEYYFWRDNLKKYMQSRPHSEHTLVGNNGKALRAFYYTAGNTPSKVVVFMIHGYRAEHNEACAPFYDYYMSRGIDIFTCDHTAHGESEGETIGFGVSESADCLAWLDYLLRMRGRGIEVILHGFSMGAATVMQMSDQCPKNVRFIVEDSGFTSAEALLRSSLGSFYGPYTKLNSILTKVDIALSDVRPHLAKTTLPILFVHGKEDRFVPFDMAPELFMACASPAKDRLYVPAARHVEAMYRAPVEYKAMLDSYLRKYLDN